MRSGSKRVGDGPEDISPVAAKAAGLGLLKAGQIILSETDPFFVRYALPFATKPELEEARSGTGKNGGGRGGGMVSQTLSANACCVCCLLWLLVCVRR